MCTVYRSEPWQGMKGHGHGIHQIPAVLHVKSLGRAFRIPKERQRKRAPESSPKKENKNHRKKEEEGQRETESAGPCLETETALPARARSAGTSRGQMLPFRSLLARGALPSDLSPSVLGRSRFALTCRRVCCDGWPVCCMLCLHLAWESHGGACSITLHPSPTTPRPPSSLFLHIIIALPLDE